MDMFNGFINLYNNGRFFRQRDVAEDFWAEDPTTLTQLLAHLSNSPVCSATTIPWSSIPAHPEEQDSG